MQFRVLLLTGALVLAACGGGPPGSGPGGEEDGPEPVADPRVLIEAEPAAMGSVADYLVTTGNLESEAQADITPETTGTIISIKAEEGDVVRRGQLLAVIDNPSLDAGVQRARLEHETAQRVIGETQQLHAQGAVSDRELREAENLAAGAETTWEEARESGDFRHITSPISGTVAVRNVRLGEMASVGMPAFQVVDLARLRVVIQLPEKDLPRVHVDQPATLTGAYEDGDSVPGHIERISPVVDPVSGTVRVVVAVDPTQQSLRPGQFVKVRIEVDRHNDVLTIPQRALTYADGEPVAWRLIEAPDPEEDDADGEGDGEGDGDGFFAKLFGDDGDGGDEAEDDFDPWEGVPRRGVEKVRLEVGFSDPDHVEVIEGLSVGDELVTIGNHNLRADTLVRLDGDPELQEPPEEEPEADGEAEPTDDGDPQGNDDGNDDGSAGG